MMSETKFYFGRIKFKHQLTGLNDFADGKQKDFSRVDRMRELLYEYTQSSDPIYSDGDSIWRFGKCEMHDGLIIGKFGKVFADQPMQYDDEVEDFVESKDDEEMADVSHFIIYPEKSVIAFNRKKHIGHSQFVESFVQGYNRYHGFSEGLMINLIKNSMEIEHLLENVSRVYEVDFALTPTNPIRDEDMKVLDAPMRSMGANEVEFSAETDGSLNTDDDFIKSGFALSNNGYGDFKIGYEENGERKIYDSRDKPATHEMENPDGVGSLRVYSEELGDRIDQLTVTDGESVINED